MVSPTAMFKLAKRTPTNTSPEAGIGTALSNSMKGIPGVFAIT